MASNKKGISVLRKALNSAESANERLKIFKKLEAKLQENELGFDCTVMAMRLLKEDQNPLNILDFGKRALNIFLNAPDFDIQKSSLAIASVLHLLGAACFRLNRFNESLSYLNWSDRNLSQLLLDNYCNDVVFKALHDTQFELFKLKQATGRGDEAVFHAKRVLEIEEKLGEKDCVEVGKANRFVSDAYCKVGNFKEALPFALKALEIYEKHFVNDSRELTVLRLRLGTIYAAAEEYDKGLEQKRLSLSGLKLMGDKYLLLHTEMEVGHMLLALGRHEEAIEAFKPVISLNETAGHQRVKALAFRGMARAFCRQGKLDNARKHIKGAVRILEKKGSTPDVVVNEFMEMAKLYEEMKEYEAAISLVQKALNIPELQGDDLATCSLSLFSLVSLTGTEKERLPILEEVVERLKEKSGPEHCHVGYAYGSLGGVYIYLGEHEMAAEILLRAKEILDVSLGPHHLASLNASNSLSVAYAGMESYDLAIEIQEKVVEGLKGLGQTEQDKVDAAVKLLNTLKGIATGEGAESHTRASRQSKDGEDLSAMISGFSVSDAGKVNK